MGRQDCGIAIEEITKEIIKDVVNSIVEKKKSELVDDNRQVEASKFLAGGQVKSSFKTAKAGSNAGNEG